MSCLACVRHHSNTGLADGDDPDRLISRRLTEKLRISSLRNPLFFAIIVLCILLPGVGLVRIPMIPATHSDMKPATHSEFIPATIPA
ncbi:hypothetical protein QO002_006331 [Pararhizobium capsulatum DSM 1112]|uniref:Uncharacterized protein n=1 Tax=Pararhizobium capsulatum DSM 1112 TaxID=1121113 RepID=A0ABU0C0U6_9HYPH|nr:hypothetical protein [Pararhizobium capsulatum]MDQ0324124.1 hypothetical protein [Pararhizobium capsulatum DSM 1112]